MATRGDGVGVARRSPAVMRTGSGAGGGVGVGATSTGGSLVSAETPASTVVATVVAFIELLAGGVVEPQPTRSANTTGKADLFIIEGVSIFAALTGA